MQNIRIWKESISEDELESIKRFGITFDGSNYHYKKFKYNKLSDAISYATFSTLES